MTYETNVHPLEHYTSYSNTALSLCSKSSTLQALNTIKTEDVVLTATTTQASSGHLRGCSVANNCTILMRRRHFPPRYPHRL